MLLPKNKLFFIFVVFSFAFNKSLAQPFDISMASYAGLAEEFPTGINAFHSDVTFNNDGTQMFTSIFGTGGGDDNIRQYSLSTAYDVSTSTFVKTNNVSSEQEGLTGIAFNDDGTKMYTIGNNPAAISEYTLSIAFDIATAVYDGAAEELSVVGQQTVPTGLTFNNDGTRVFVLGLGSNFFGPDDERISEYDLSTPYDVSTGTFTGVGEELDVSGQDLFPTDLTFNDNGLLLFIVGATDNAVVEYSLTTAFDVSTATHSGVAEELNIAAQEGEPRGIAFNDVGNKLFVHGFDDAVIEYTISDPLPIELLSFSAHVINQKSVNLIWETASESNNDFFTLERSFNAVNWARLVDIKGAGNSSHLIRYDWIDKSPYLGLSYYRLKQTDFDGAFEYSPIVSVQIGKTTTTLDISPNPAKDLITIKGMEGNLIQVISFYDAFGRDVSNKVVLNETMQTISADISHLSSGIYYIRANNQTAKFIVL